MRYSFSQIETFLECPTQWYLKYIEKLYDPFEDKHYANEGNRIQAILTRYWKGEEAFTKEEEFLYRIFEEIQFPKQVEPNKNITFYDKEREYICKLDGFSEPNIVYELKTAQDLNKSSHKHRISYQIPLYVYSLFQTTDLTEITSKLIVIKNPPQDENLSKKIPKAWYQLHTKIWARTEAETCIRPFLDLCQQMEKMENLTRLDLLKNYQSCTYCPFKNVCADNDYSGLIRKEKP